MKIWKWILVIGIALVVVVPAGMYAFDYMNEYEVTVSMEASSEALGVIYLNEITPEVEPMDWLSFWDILKGHSTGEDRADYYFVAVEITNKASGESVTSGERIVLGAGDVLDFSVTVFEVTPGDSTMRIYVESLYTGGIIYDQSTDLIVG